MAPWPPFARKFSCGKESRTCPRTYCCQKAACAAASGRAKCSDVGSEPANACLAMSACHGTGLRMQC